MNIKFISCIYSSCSNKLNSLQKESLYLEVLRLSGAATAVGVATRYGMDGPGIECRWGQDIPSPSRPALGPTYPPKQCVPYNFWG